MSQDAPGDVGGVEGCAWREAPPHRGHASTSTANTRRIRSVTAAVVQACDGACQHAGIATATVVAERVQSEREVHARARHEPGQNKNPFGSKSTCVALAPYGRRSCTAAFPSGVLAIRSLANAGVQVESLLLRVTGAA